MAIPPNNAVTEVPLSFTSDYIIRVYNLLATNGQMPEVAAYWQSIKVQQDALAKQLVAKTSVCNVNMLNSLRDHVGGLRANTLKSVVTDQFYNPEAMAATMCAVDSIFYSSPSDIGSAFLNDRIRLYVHNLRQIGSESAEGYAFLSDFENAKDLFVVKVSRNPSDDSLLHELIVGLFGTNKLRRYVPNFSYIYGGFKCSPPLVDSEEKKVVTWCLHSNNPVNYVLYENIAPATELAEYVTTCTGKEFVNAYLQILYALRLAVSMISFSHYDLHYKNVLIRRPMKQAFQIIYQTERGSEYLTSQFIATIIDYGFSHIVADNQHFGKSGFVPYSVYPDRPWIMHDLYKLLMFSSQAAMAAGNWSMITEAEKIFNFFNKGENFSIALSYQAKVFFSFPLTQDTSALSVDDLARYIRTVCDCDFIQATGSQDPILNCETLCPTENTVLNQVGLDLNGPIRTPDNIFEFSNLIIRLQNEGRESERQQVQQLFPYDRAMPPHLRKMSDILRDLSALRRRLKLISLESIPVTQILNYNTMMLVRSMYLTVAAIVDRATELTYYYTVGTQIAQMYADTVSISKMSDLYRRYQETIKPALDEAVIILKRNDAVISQVQTDPIAAELIQRDPRLQWYWQGLRLYNTILGPTIAQI